MLADRLQARFAGLELLLLLFLLRWPQRRRRLVQRCTAQQQLFRPPALPTYTYENEYTTCHMMDRDPRIVCRPLHSLAGEPYICATSSM